MDTKMSKSHELRVNPPGIKACLTSAVLEWFLIGLLYINALLSYIITKFARSFKLQTPCLLCSRLDHVVGDEKPGFYKDLICSTHQLEVSSLVFCHIHNKIADVHGLCESCLFSFATERKSNPETFRLLVGKLGTDLTDDETKVIHSSNERQCTCCTELFNSRLYTQGFLQMKSIEPDVGELGDPFPRSIRTNRSLSINGLKNKKRLTTPKSVNWSGGRNRSFDPLTTVGYTEVKITSDSETEAPFSDALGYTEVKLTSDSESEVPFSDEDQHHNYGNGLVSEKHGLEKEFVGKFVEPDLYTGNPEKSPRNVPNDLVKEKLIHQDSTEKLIHQDSMPEHLILFSDVQLDDVKPQSSAIDIGHGLEELNWHQEQKSNPSVLSEPLHDVPSPPDSCEAVVEVSEKTLVVKETSEEEFKNSEASSEIGMQILQKRITLERNESNLSLDGSIVSEIEGESVVDRLKRQVEYDRKSMNALYKELEEESNASEIAANQAMAMITRLQEEKATLHMEALQYLRMMEEQSEYDVEAIQKAHDLLARREKEMQDLEAELEIYREKCESNFPPDKDYEDINKQKADKCVDNGVQEEVPNSEYSENKTHDTSDQEQIGGAGEGHKLDGVDSSKNKETDLVPVLHEVSELNERLKALEADRSFLEHMINSRDDGVQFIQKIAHHLQGIREMDSPRYFTR
ncbi:hypothetical protein C5167_024189 [Papaver somniferum]|uniref:GTD-binding domain-containing protein n=1 Tax=Papaver somniferum TaxID=3469 RepID=A0A4Y7JRU9_PAPSO|nr:hypothetical protein C5167_024189 [Papaver somniferum]